MPPESRADRLAHFFRDRPGEWLDGRILATVAGAYGWRSRVADIRRAPHFMNVENRMRRIKTRDGSKFTISEYRFTEGAREVPTTDAPTSIAGRT